jgi:hypothetical protein
LGALYFSGDVLPPLAYATVDAIQQTGWATAIPLHVRYRVGEHRVVGTTPDYFGFRHLRVAAGIGHGHVDLDDPEAASSVLRRSDDSIIANASVVEYQEIEPSSLANFHFHGKLSEFPLSAVVAVPDDSRSGTLLQGR